MVPYMLLDSNTSQFQVLTRCFESQSALLQRATPVDVNGLLKSEDSVDTAVFDRLANEDDALRHVKYFVFDPLHLLALKCNLYSEGGEWFELLLYSPRGRGC